MHFPPVPKRDDYSDRKKKYAQEILDARFFSILADEATSHNEEKLAIVIRLVDSNRNIREEFVDFKSLERTTGAAISNSILECLRDLNIPITDCRGQGYHGTAAMISEGVGVQAEIRRRAPKAVYIHCAGHSLNFVISSSCGLPEIQTMISKVKEVCRHLFQLQSLAKWLPISSNKGSISLKCKGKAS